MLLAETMNTARPRPLAGYFALGRLLERLAPLTDLLLRLAVFRIFFWSGLAKLDDWYVLTQLKKFKAGIRGANPADVSGATMRPMAATLPDEQAMRDVVAHIQGLSK